MATEYSNEERNTVSSDIKLNVGKHTSPNDLELEETIRDLGSCQYFQSTPVNEAKTTVLHNALGAQFVFQARSAFIYGLGEMIFAYFIPRSIGNADSRTTMFLFFAFYTSYLLYAVRCAVRKRLGKCMDSLEWYAFYSQVLFDSGPALGFTDHSALKCHILRFAVPLVLALALSQTRFPITGPLAAVLIGLVPATLVFTLHSFIPYGSVLGLYTAVIYTAAWCMYIIHDSSKKAIVKATKQE
ncbi:hypothetical protein GGI03_004948 [Coemansia sp. RSA 2337]|nr:hypothetical protein GGI03_004948 [Coemansia sp. RSA 2337]